MSKYPKYLYTERPDADERRRKAMKEGLEHLAEYCARRASMEFCPSTTMTVLKQKVMTLQTRVHAAGVVRTLPPPEEWSPTQP